MTPLLAQRLRTDRSFERLYRRHVEDVYHYALAVCRNSADAEDVTQTTFMNAYRAVQAGEQPRAPKNWLLAIAHNVMRQRFRQRARRPDEVELDDAAGAQVPDDEGYSVQDIRRALGELAFNQRAALVMRELEGRSYAEIAEILGVSVSAVETLIFRARRALREQLEGSLTCVEAEAAISKQLDGRLTRAEKGVLRGHIRACKECASFARSQRAQRAALKGLAAIPLPTSLTSLFGGGGAAVGTAVATKAAAFTAVGLLITGAGVETARVVRDDHPRRAAAGLSPAATPAVPAPDQTAVETDPPRAKPAVPAAAALAHRNSKPKRFAPGTPDVVPAASDRNDRADAAERAKTQRATQNGPRGGTKPAQAGPKHAARTHVTPSAGRSKAASGRNAGHAKPKAHRRRARTVQPSGRAGDGSGATAKGKRGGAAKGNP